MRLIDADKLIEKGYTLERIYQEDSSTMVLEKCKIEDIPVVDIVNSPKDKLQRAIDGKTEEEIYDFLHWLMYYYAKQFTDSRAGVIQWLKEEEDEYTN